MQLTRALCPQQLQRNRLSRTEYPYEGAELSGRISNVIVFVVGGTTYVQSCLSSHAAFRRVTSLGVCVLQIRGGMPRGRHERCWFGTAHHPWRHLRPQLQQFRRGPDLAWFWRSKPGWWCPRRGRVGSRRWWPSVVGRKSEEDHVSNVLIDCHLIIINSV